MVLHQGQEFLGIVSSRRDYKERDMLVKIFTDRFGFKTFYVRGVKKRGFRLGAIILPFSHGRYLGSINDQGLSYLNLGKEIDQYQQIFQDIFLNAYASYILGLAEVGIKEDSSLAAKWFGQVDQALTLIDQGFEPSIITNIMEVQMLTLFGVRPELRYCSVCQNPQRPFDYSENYGGLLCQKHWPLDPYRLHLDARTIYYLQLFSALDLKRLNSIKVKDETKQHLKQALDTIYNDQVGIYIPAKKFLQEMNEIKF